MKAMPKTLYVKTDKDGTATYFVADADASTLVEMGETIRIGKYQLVEITDATGVAEFKRSRRRA